MYEEFDKLKEKELLKIIAVITLSDGTLNINKNYIRLVTSAKSECMHDLFKKICYGISEREPKTCKTNIKSGFSNKTEHCIQTTLTSKQIIDKLLKLSPNYKTTKGNLSKEEFLKTKQPQLKFLFNSNKNLKWLAFRLWFDFDGCLIPSFKLKKKHDKKGEKIYTYYQVQFEAELRIAETNPCLVEDLIKLCSQLNLNAIKKRKEKNWSGLDGICISRLNDVKEFVSKGGPITKILISDKSPRFSGIAKKKLCAAVLSLLGNNNIKKSKYFKNKLEAVEYKNKMDAILINMIARN